MKNFFLMFFPFVLLVIFGADYKVIYVYCKKINNWKTTIEKTTIEKIICPWVDSR